MVKNDIKMLIGESHKYIRESSMIYRPVFFDINANYVLVGIRRAGKSYLMLQDIKTRIENNEARVEDCLLINFEDERLAGIQVSDLGLILECYAEMYGEKKPLVYLDEIQNVNGWEKFVRRLVDQKYRVMVTGSNAKMLSSEIATTLGGRFVVREIYPFSFEEYLMFCGISIDSNWCFNPEVRRNIIRHFEQYFHFGGFAEAFNMIDKREYVNSLYQKILLGDIIARNKIRGDRSIRLLARKVAENVMQPTAISRFLHIIKSSGECISQATVKDYLQYMEQSYLIFSVPNYASPITEQETIKKRYYYDNALVNILTFQNDTKLLENICAIHLVKKYSCLDEPRVFYYNRNMEVDFYIPEEKMAIQVSYNISDDETKDREVGALIHMNKVFHLEHAVIVTYDQENTYVEDNLTIDVVPVYKWLLGY